jgi:hypothetical protein
LREAGTGAASALLEKSLKKPLCFFAFLRFLSVVVVAVRVDIMMRMGRVVRL